MNYGVIIHVTDDMPDFETSKNVTYFVDNFDFVMFSIHNWLCISPTSIYIAIAQCCMGILLNIKRFKGVMLT